jgi:hypothetical protein
MQQVVGPNVECTLQGTVGRVLHYAAWKKTDHYARYDFAFVARQQEQSVFAQFKIFMKFFLWLNWQILAD